MALPVAEPGDHKVTVADIAAVAGVSVATVSKVLNGRPDVSRRTRARVQTLLEDNQYVRTPRTKRKVLATAQPTASGGLVDLVFNDAGSPWAAEMISGVQSAVRSARASVVVSVLGPGTTTEDSGCRT